MFMLPLHHLFCWSVSKHDFWWMMPLDWKNEDMATNFMPLSDLRHLRDFLNWFSMYVINWIRLGFVWYLVLIKITHVYLKWSYTRVRKYLWPKLGIMEKGPHKSACNISKGEVECTMLLGKWSFFCLAKWHESQGKWETFA